MAANSKSERLTPLDLLMPSTYIATLLAFRTTQSTSAISQTLESGLGNVFKQLPWLSGRVFPTEAAPGQKPTLEIRWAADDGPPTLVDKGLISAAYETLSAQGMDPAAIPPDVWPAPSMVDESLFSRGAPVFAASVFRFADNQGVGLCVCMHHNAVDATGFAEVLRLWAFNTSRPGSLHLSRADSRLTQLRDAISTELASVSTLSPDTLFTLHPEYSRTPPALPTSFPPCKSKLFRIPIKQINAVKELLGANTSTTPSTNTVLCGLIWSVVTHVRKQHNPALENHTSRLVTAVNGRRRIGEEFSTPQSPYLGNVVLYSLAELAVEDVSAYSAGASKQSLAAVCDIISRSQSPDRINLRYVAEVYGLVDRMENYKAILLDGTCSMRKTSQSLAGPISVCMTWTLETRLGSRTLLGYVTQRRMALA
ncbi:transferase family domain-containing protein [Trichoderma aethiopicum]